MKGTMSDFYGYPYFCNSSHVCFLLKIPCIYTFLCGIGLVLFGLQVQRSLNPSKDEVEALKYISRKLWLFKYIQYILQMIQSQQKVFIDIFYKIYDLFSSFI